MFVARDILWWVMVTKTFAVTCECSAYVKDVYIMTVMVCLVVVGRCGTVCGAFHDSQFHVQVIFVQV